jgi:hypothetical protein
MLLGAMCCSCTMDTLCLPRAIAGGFGGEGVCGSVSGSRVVQESCRTRQRMRKGSSEADPKGHWHGSRCAAVHGASYPPDPVEPMADTVALAGDCSRCQVRNLCGLMTWQVVFAGHSLSLRRRQHLLRVSTCSAHSAGRNVLAAWPPQRHGHCWTGCVCCRGTLRRRQRVLRVSTGGAC